MSMRLSNSAGGVTRTRSNGLMHRVHDTEDHARKFLRYALKLRKVVDHAIKFETTPQSAMNMEPGDYFGLLATPPTPSDSRAAALILQATWSVPNRCQLVRRRRLCTGGQARQRCGDHGPLMETVESVMQSFTAVCSAARPAHLNQGVSMRKPELLRRWPCRDQRFCCTR